MGISRSEYAVVINHEEQYSIWPKTESLPKGYRQVSSGDLREMTERVDALIVERDAKRKG